MDCGVISKDEEKHGIVTRAVSLGGELETCVILTQCH